MTEELWSISYGGEGPTIEPVINSCREYDCCGGKDCGFTTEKAQEYIAQFYQERADMIRNMSLKDFLIYEGYGDVG